MKKFVLTLMLLVAPLVFPVSARGQGGVVIREPGLIPAFPGITRMPINLDDLAAVQNAELRARQRIPIDNFRVRVDGDLTRVSQACGQVAQERAPDLLAHLAAGGFPGWRVRTITAATGFHTTVLITSPDGKRHYLVDNYAGFVQTAPMEEVMPNRWIPAKGAEFDTAWFLVIGLTNVWTPAAGTDFFDGVVGGNTIIGSGTVRAGGCRLQPTTSRALMVQTVQARDPNDKAGAQGATGLRYLSGGEPVRYSIFFENQATATAPAQEVIITDQLDATKMDLSTFSLGPISFGDKQVVPPPGLKQYSTDVDLRPAKSLIVRIAASLASTGVVTWRFASIDPATGQLTEDPLGGFLPPNVNPPEGDGSVLFTVMPKTGLPSGTEIRNKATIIFDVNPPIDTPVWLNTLDNTKPSSQVQALAGTQSSPSFDVQWTGTDAHAGILDYTMFVSEDGGPFTPFLRNTAATSATFTGQSGKTYAFFSVARDGAGNVEDPPAFPDASTQVVAAADAIAPVTTATPTPGPNPNGLNNTNVAVNLTAVDNEGGSGVREISYTLSGAETGGSVDTGSSTSVTISAEGTTTLTYFARDNTGNEEAARTLTVRIDKTVPILNVPANVTENATSPSGATVAYSSLVSATDNLDTNPIVSCNPPSGSTLPIGISTVACTATDVADNTVSRSFQVTVKGASEQIVDLIVKVAKIFNRDSRITDTLKATLQRALDALIARKVDAVCKSLTAFIKAVQAQAGKKITLAQANELIADANRIRAVLSCR